MNRTKYIFLLFITIGYAQVSINDINKIGNEQLDLIREEIQKQGTVTTVPTETISVPKAEEVKIVSPDRLDKSYGGYFGYEYFQNDISFFDNIPTPDDFKLGPGDEIILSIWGETNIRQSFTINKEGLIFYKNIGFINIANKTIKESEDHLVKKLSQIYSTLLTDSNSTNLMVELGRIKSLNIYFSGEVFDPGIHLVHPFSDILSALIQSGGIKKSGSLRNIQILRKGEVVEKIDFYQFFTNGKNNFFKINLIDGDVIHVPVIKKRVLIDGEINRSKSYELLENESLHDLIIFAANVTAKASSNIIIDNIIPMDMRTGQDNAKTSKNVNLKDAKNIFLNNGDSVDIKPIGSVNSKVRVYGQVKSPGEYSSTNSSLKDVLDIAGGFNDPIFRKSIHDDEIVVVRKNDGQFRGIEFKISYDKSDSFLLFPEDKIFVYEDSNYNNFLSVQILGEVNKRGRFHLKKGMNVQDLINSAGGFTEIANKNAILIEEVFTSINADGDTIEERTSVNDASLEFPITDGAVITVLPLENVIMVKGNVYNPGLIVHSGSKSLKKYVNLAGGAKPNTLTKDIYVKRSNGRIKKVSLLRGVGINIKPGDTIFVPEDPNPRGEFDITTFIADLASTLANIAAILFIVDNQND